VKALLFSVYNCLFARDCAYIPRKRPHNSALKPVTISTGVTISTSQSFTCIVSSEAIAHRYQFGRTKRNANRIDVANMNPSHADPGRDIHMGTWGSSTSLRPGARVQFSEFLSQSLSIEWKIFITFTWTQLGPSACAAYLVSRSTSVSLGR
jgi:hypothetical protein